MFQARWIFSVSLALLLVSGSAIPAKAEGGKDDPYMTGLKKKYVNNISFSSAQAFDIVEDFEIECRSNDGRYLPLINVLYSQIESLTSGSNTVKMNVVNHGEEVRIYETLVGKDGPNSKPVLDFEINEWHELHAVGFWMEAVLNSCYGTYGHIWVTP